MGQTTLRVLTMKWAHHLGASLDRAVAVLAAKLLGISFRSMRYRLDRLKSINTCLCVTGRLFPFKRPVT